MWRLFSRCGPVGRARGLRQISVRQLWRNIMNIRFLRIPALALLAAFVLAVLLSPMARSQMQASPSYIPIGVSATGNTSTVWFHEPFSRQALACQTVSTATGLSSIQCVSAKLP
jgi:hypothetical protein